MLKLSTKTDKVDCPAHLVSVHWSRAHASPCRGWNTKRSPGRQNAQGRPRHSRNIQQKRNEAIVTMLDGLDWKYFSRRKMKGASRTGVTITEVPSSAYLINANHFSFWMYIPSCILMSRYLLPTLIQFRFMSISTPIVHVLVTGDR